MPYGFLFQPFLLAAKLLTNSRFRLFLGSFCAEEYQDVAEYQWVSCQCREDFALRDMAFRQPTYIVDKDLNVAE